MKVEELISFRLKGDYALFKKPWCNREQQSFLVPTKTALTGMIGGVIGLKKDEYLEKLPPDDIKIGIRLEKKITKELHGYNFLQSENLASQTRNFSNPLRSPTGKGSRSPNRLEMLKKPSYRIFIHLSQENLFNKLHNYLEAEKCVFPPFLGQVNLFANITETKKEKVKRKKLDSVSTIAPAETVKPLKMRGEIYKERIPVRMQPDRSKPEFLPVAFKNKESASIPVDSSDEFFFGETENGERISLF